MSQGNEYRWTIQYTKEACIKAIREKCIASNYGHEFIPASWRCDEVIKAIEEAEVLNGK